MMDDTKRALLGDHEAAKRLTDAGVLLPCPMCEGQARVRNERYYQPKCPQKCDLHEMLYEQRMV